MNKKFKSLLQLLGFVFACELIGASGSLFTASSIPTWYAALTKPSVNPPNWVFGPVWTTLFMLMGVAAFLVWRKGFDTERVKRALSIFAVQFALNVLWSVLFFGFHRPLVAFVEIIILWFAILWTTISFWNISHSAAVLLVPYLAWVSLAAYLNFMIWRLN